jgi:hypothetical protein
MDELQVLRGFIANVDVIPPLIFTFQYNPESVADNKKVQYVDRSTELCGNAPGKFYVGGGDRIISFSFKLHGLEQGLNAVNPTGVDNGISTELAKLRSFLYPKADAWATFSAAAPGGMRLAAPPTCFFGFGTKILEGTITDMQINETQFNSSLAPVRADVTVTIAVDESTGNTLYEVDKQHRNLLAALGLQNISLF